MKNKKETRGRPKMTDAEKLAAKQKRERAKKKQLELNSKGETILKNAIKAPKVFKAGSMSAAINRKKSKVDLGELLQVVTNLASAALKLCKDYHELKSGQAFQVKQIIEPVLAPVITNPNYVDETMSAAPPIIKEQIASMEKASKKTPLKKLVKSVKVERDLSQVPFGTEDTEDDEEPSLLTPKKKPKKVEKVSKAKAVIKPKKKPPAPVEDDEDEEDDEDDEDEDDRFGSIPESNLDDVLS